MSKPKRVITFLDQYLELIFGSIFLACMVIFTFLNIFLRICFRTTLPWFQELTRYLFVWLVFISISAAVRHKNHIRITFLQTWLKGRALKTLEIIVYCISAAFGVFCLFSAVPMVQSFASANMTASSMPWFKMSWLYSIMPIGMALFALRNIQAIILELRRPTEATEEKEA